MSYVIHHCAKGGYVKIKAGNTKGSWATLLKNATKFTTLEKATNFMDNNFPGLYPSNDIVEVKILNVDDLTEVYDVKEYDYSEDEAKDLLEKMISFYGSITEETDKFISLPKYYGNVVKQCDLETLDVLHKIEFTNENVVNGFKRYKQLQDIRLRRRVAKDALEFSSLLVSSGLLACLKKLRTDIDELKEFGETREYRPRILTSMFDDPEEENN